MAVVFFHFGGEVFRNAPAALKTIVSGGGDGVALFFILSGFVLAYNYADSAEKGRIDKSLFWRARFARIYPVYLLALLLSLPFSAASIFRNLRSFALAVTLTQDWDFRRSSIWNFPAWTLSVEMFFYLVFPWAFVAVCKLKPAKLLPAVCGLIIVNIGVKVAYLSYLTLNPATLDFLGTHRPDPFGVWLISAWPPVRLPEFLIGLVLGRMYLIRPELRIKRRNAVSILSVLGILIVVSFGPIPGRSSTALLDPLLALLIYTLASGPGMFAGFLSLPFIVLLGDASYAVYILQVPIMKSAGKVLGSSALTFWVGLLALTGVSVVSYMYFETPIRRWLRRRWT